MHLFAFEFYCNLVEEIKIKNKQTISQSAENKRNSKHIGKGHKKALIKWYNKRNEMDLLRLVTQYDHSYNWSNKDLFKLIHMKPKNESMG